MAADPNQHILFDCPSEGDAGEEWHDGVYTGIHQIIVVYGDDAIDSIHIEYDNNGSPFWSELGGSAENIILRSFRSGPRRRAGNKIGKIRLDYPHEILTSISGHYDTYLRSLTFESNTYLRSSPFESNLKKKYGPYGSQQGTPFGYPHGDWKIVGFYGRSAPYLVQHWSFSCFYCIGVYRSSFRKSVKPISIGPWPPGGNNEDMWDDDRVYSGIHQILVVYDVDRVYSIDIQYDNNGSRCWLGHGRSTGNKIEKIQLDYPTEILTSISGCYDIHGISSLTFEINSKKRGPYGRQAESKVRLKTTPFSIPIRDGKIVGFYGRSDEFLRIGVYLSNLDNAVHPKCGPWGEGERGDLWDDGAYSGIRGIRYRYRERGRGRECAICSIGFEYDQDGRTLELEEHGNNHGELQRIPLNPGVILTSISGYYDTCVRKLTFGTSGSYSSVTFPAQDTSPLWTYFSIPIGNGKIVGFHGRSDEYLRCIGVYLSN